VIVANLLDILPFVDGLFA